MYAGSSINRDLTSGLSVSLTLYGILIIGSYGWNQVLQGDRYFAACLIDPLLVAAIGLCERLKVLNVNGDCYVAPCSCSC